MEKEEILVSVYCLTYNQEKYIRDALEGFVNQKTDFLYEVWVHDDASQDATPQIIKEYAARYPQIIKPILQMENQYSKGVKIFQTHILPKVNGKYVAVCEGDDYWCDVDKLQKQVDFMEAHQEYVACVHNSKVLDMRTQESWNYNISESDGDICVEDILRWSNKMYQTASLLYKKECGNFWVHDFLNVKGFSDYPLAIHLALSGKIHYFADCMSVYRMFSEGSWTARYEKSAQKKKKEHQKKIKKMLKGVDLYTAGKYHKVISEIVKNMRKTSIASRFPKLYGLYKKVRK